MSKPELHQTTDNMIASHLRAALKRIDRGDMSAAQRNIEYAASRMRDLVGLPEPCLDSKEAQELGDG